MLLPYHIPDPTGLMHLIYYQTKEITFYIELFTNHTLILTCFFEKCCCYFYVFTINKKGNLDPGGDHITKHESNSMFQVHKVNLDPLSLHKYLKFTKIFTKVVFMQNDRFTGAENY